MNKLDEYFNSLPSDSVAKNQYATIKFSTEKTRKSIFTLAMTGLVSYVSDRMAKLTSRNSIDLEKIGFYDTYKCKVIIKNTLSDEDKDITANPIQNEKGIIEGLKEKVFISTDTFNDDYFKNDIGSSKIITLEQQIENSLKGEVEEEINTKERVLKDILLRNVIVINNEGINITESIELDIVNVVEYLEGEYLVEYKIPLEKPKAIFMVTPDYDKSNHILTSIFIRQLYYVLAKKSSLNTTSKCDREVIFLLDEFGNMPPIEGFENIITVCLGRRIKFNMIIQAYSQLEVLYDKNSKTIEGNCGNQIYILTNENDTAEKFSKLIGEKTIITNSRSGQVFSTNKSHTESLDTRRLLKADELTKLREGETVVVRVIKRQDNKKEKIQSYPIFNEGEHYMKYRYEYLNEWFDNTKNVFKNIKVESIHKDINLRDLILDYERLNVDIIRRNGADKIESDDKDIVESLDVENEVVKEEQKDVEKFDKIKVLKILSKDLDTKEIELLREIESAEDLKKFLNDIGKEQLIYKIKKII